MELLLIYSSLEHETLSSLVVGLEIISYVPIIRILDQFGLLLYYIVPLDVCNELVYKDTEETQSWDATS